MGKIFKTRKDLKIFALIMAIVLFVLFLIINANSFENDWYNMDYNDYKREPESYSVAEATIKEFDTLTRKDTSSLSLIDCYYTAIVDVTYAGGQIRTCRVPRDAGDEIGNRISVAYDKRYDTEYEEAMASEDVDGVGIPEIARTEKVKFTRYSTVLIVIECVLVFLAVLYMIWCSKKEKTKIFFE